MWMIRAPSVRNTSSNGPEYLESRSCRRNRASSRRSSIERSRACCVTHAESGCAVTPARWTRLVDSSMKNSAYSVFSRIVSTVRKSVARMPRAWARRNADQVGVGHRNADSGPDQAIPKFGLLAVHPAASQSHWCHFPLTMFTKQVSRSLDSLDSPSWPPRRSKSSELEERPGHGTDPRFLCPSRYFPCISARSPKHDRPRCLVLLQVDQHLAFWPRQGTRSGSTLYLQMSTRESLALRSRAVSRKLRQT